MLLTQKILQPLIRVAGLALFYLSACQGSSPSHQAASPQGRYALGVAKSGPPGSALSVGDLVRLRGSFAERRRHGWELASRLVETEGVVPRFLTWYAKDDVERMFTFLYERIGREGRLARRAFTTAELDEAEQWNSRYVESFWSPERLQTWLASVDRNERTLSLNGVARILYNPLALRHILQNYQRLASCLDSAEETCLAGEFPTGATIAKAVWQRADFGRKVARYLTGGDDLRHLFSAVEWGGGESLVEPEAIPTMTTDEDQSYRLVGLHGMVKESSDWTWLTLWWAEDADADFGADRIALPTPWSSFKMCIVVDDDEDAGDEIPLALRPVWDVLRERKESWCSNPFIERGANNHLTNCIGCHQHAGTNATSEEILADPVKARKIVRSTFPADYAWSLTRTPQGLATIFRRRIQHADTIDRGL